MSEGHKTSIKDIPSQAIHEKIETVHGIKYIIIGPIETPIRQNSYYFYCVDR